MVFSQVFNFTKIYLTTCLTKAQTTKNKNLKIFMLDAAASVARAKRIRARRERARKKNAKVVSSSKKSEEAGFLSCEKKNSKKVEEEGKRCRFFLSLSLSRFLFR